MYTSFIRDVASSLRQSWRGLVAIDLLYKILAFVLLTPLFAALFRSLLALSGNSVLSDVDIAMFFAGPFGWCCAIILGAVWLGIVALEQASLLWMLAERSRGERTSVWASLRFAALNSSIVIRTSARLVFWTMIVMMPFLLIAGGVFLWFLTEYDINYYLAERPTEFKVAVTIGVVLAVISIGVLLRLYSGWFLVLPLVLFENEPPNRALRASKKLVSGNRRRVLTWLVLWIAAMLLANAVSTVLIGGAGRLLIPTSVGSPAVLAFRVGLMLLVLASVSLAINLFATIGFSGILFHGFQSLNPKAGEAIDDTHVANESKLQGPVLFTRWQFALAGVVGVLASALVGYWSLNSTRFNDDVKIMAHRGASFVAPENTMAAFQQAIEAGADWIEIDVQETLDGEVVVLHDSDFMKLSANPLKIWDANLNDLKDIDVGSWFDPAFSDERVPTLQEVLQLCKGKIDVNIELKYYGHDQQLEQRVVDIVEGEGMSEQVMVMSLKPQGVAKTKALRPEWKCGLLLSVYVGDMQKMDADFLAVNANFASRSFVKRAHKVGKKVFVWTVNDAAMMSQAMNRNVDGILTDRPDLARQVLAQRANMSNAERLLSEIAIYFRESTENIEP